MSKKGPKVRLWKQSGLMELIRLGGLWVPVFVFLSLAKHAIQMITQLVSKTMEGSKQDKCLVGALTG